MNQFAALNSIMDKMVSDGANSYDTIVRSIGRKMNNIFRKMTRQERREAELAINTLQMEQQIKEEGKITMVDWSYFNKFESISDKYLPSYGEGETKASQIVTAVTKLVYKWYNDGDVYDNTHAMTGWANDLSSYANWLRKYTDAAGILDRIQDCWNNGQYEDLLKALADKLLDDEDLEQAAKQKKIDSIYKAEGPYRFEERYDDDEEEY